MSTFPSSYNNEQTESDDNYYTYDQFLEDHRIALLHFNIPSPLWIILYEKLNNQLFDSGNYFIFTVNEQTNKLQTNLGFEQGIGKESNIFLIDHAWTYSSRTASRSQLSTIPNLLERMLNLMEIAPTENKETNIDLVMSKLHLYGFQFELVDQNNPNINKLNTHYYVLDELGSRFGQSEDPNFKQVPILFAKENIAYTVCWPIRDVEYGEVATTAIRMPLDDFDNQTYWDTRYQIMGSELLDEWYFSFADITTYLTSPRVENGEFPPLLTKESSVFLPGCGNSSFGYDMYVAGYKNVVNLDYSETCIAQMKEKYNDCPEIVWKVGDVTDLSELKEDFDLILDKGCFDAVVSANNIEAGRKCLAEMNKLLSPNGRFLLFSLGSPDIRREILETYLDIESYSTRSVHNEMSQNDITRGLTSLIHVYICKRKVINSNSVCL